jgi:ABC-type transport system involved in multi-copper enzyme maturation permease subunit
MLRGPHLNLIARHSVRHSLRGGAGLIAILATLVIGLVLASIVISPLEQVGKFGKDKHSREMLHGASDEEVAQVQSQMVHEVTTIAKRAMGWVMDASDDNIDYLVNDKPAMVSAVLILLTLVTPLFACLAGFNQTAGDIATKGLRYLLFRTERQNIFLGRFIGTALFTMASFAVLFVILGIYIAAKINVHPTGDMMLWLAGGYLRLIILALPYVAVCAWISASIDSSFGALMIALLVTYMWPLLVTIGKMSNDNVQYAQYLTPWGYKWLLFSEQPAMVGLGVGVMLAFTIVLVFVGLNRFAKRDL